MVEVLLRAGRPGVRLRPDDTMYVCLPLYHNNALSVSLSSVLASGACIAIGRSFSASKFWDDVILNRATAFCYIGELCRYLLVQPEKPTDRQHSVHTVVGNGMRPEIWDEFKQRKSIIYDCPTWEEWLEIKKKEYPMVAVAKSVRLALSGELAETVDLLNQTVAPLGGLAERLPKRLTRPPKGSGGNGHGDAPADTNGYPRG